MKLVKGLPAAVAAGTLLMAQPAMALANHDDVPTDEMGAPKASQPLFFFLGLAAVVIIIALIVEKDNHSLPHSP